MLTRKTDYALRALLYLKENDDRIVPTKEVAEKLGIPYKFLTQIFLNLIRGGLVSSERGSKGGMKLKVKPNSISLLDVIEAMEGPFVIHNCLSEAKEECFFNNDCPVREKLRKIETQTRNILSKTTLKSIKTGSSLKRRN